MRRFIETVHIEYEQRDRLLPPTAALHQHAARLRNEAARLKAAHRYFQRTATRRPFRREEMIEPV
jgi:hypothetical protein